MGSSQANGSCEQDADEEKYSFIKWLRLTIVTCGLYHFYHEYQKSSDIAKVVGDASGQEPVVNLLLTVFGLGIVADAIQQGHINRHFGSTNL